MSRPLSTSNELSMRKDLVRLRMEMHRQQMLYHAQPLSHPLQQIKGFVTSRRSSADPSSGKGPLMIAATVVLAARSSFNWVKLPARAGRIVR